MIQGRKISKGRSDRVARPYAPTAIPAGHRSFGFPQACGITAERELDILAAPGTAEARLAALAIAVETLLALHLSALPEADSAALKARLLALGGYESAEPCFTAAEALPSATAVELGELLLAAIRQETELRVR